MLLLLVGRSIELIVAPKDVEFDAVAHAASWLVGFDAKSAFQAECTAYEATEHDWSFDAVEEIALKNLQRAVAQS
jgi:hypothetical protein